MNVLGKNTLFPLGVIEVLSQKSLGTYPFSVSVCVKLALSQERLFFPQDLLLGYSTDQDEIIIGITRKL
jgi:hypothetical protein